MVGHAVRVRLEVAAFLEVFLEILGVLSGDFRPPGMVVRVAPSGDRVVPDWFAIRLVRGGREGMDGMRVPVIGGRMGAEMVGCPAARGPLAIRCTLLGRDVMFPGPA